MKVKDCEKCVHYEIKRWVSTYEPSNYHIIGASHRYGYCRKYRQRCLNIKDCQQTPTTKENLVVKNLK